MDRIPGLPLVALAVGLGPARALDDEELCVPRMPVDGGQRAGIDLVHERIEAARGRVAVPAHVDAGAHAPRGGLEHHVFLADHRAAVLAPLLDELRPPLLLDVVVRDRGRGLGRHFRWVSYMWNRVPAGAKHHRITRLAGQSMRTLLAIALAATTGAVGAQDKRVVF